MEVQRHTELAVLEIVANIDPNILSTSTGEETREPLDMRAGPLAFLSLSWTFRFRRDWVVESLRTGFVKAFDAFSYYFFGGLSLVLLQGTSVARLYGLTCFYTHPGLWRPRGENERLKSGRT
uniref:(California timema) hypothetical protein n=1 Tax=Timema californicum TaxID=61474 RepID=A0A7R9IZ37_TIMCA|nr:unnamed protein product [Timema californicum]